MPGCSAGVSNGDIEPALQQGRVHPVEYTLVKTCVLLYLPCLQASRLRAKRSIYSDIDGEPARGFPFDSTRLVFFVVRNSMPA
jgi:hypothetical protein